MMTIALPPKVYILRPKKNQDIVVDREEYHIYFDNIILPYSELQDVKVQCDYGRNCGRYWVIDSFPYEVDSFPLKMMVYSECGEKLAEKNCEVILTDKAEDAEPYGVMCIGDSMTHRYMYVNHISHKLRNLQLRGTRSFDGHVFMEGRGGWQYKTYFESHEKNWHGPSPFLFPQGITPELYYGDIDFEAEKRKEGGLTYAYDGFPKYTLEDGMYYHKDQKIWQFIDGEHRVVNEAPVWEFSFTKYMKRFQPGKVDCVSLLMGGNDLQIVDYEDSDKAISRYLSCTEKMIASVREYDPHIAIILNLPIAGADQMAWGKRLQCYGTAKQYRYNAIRAARAMIDKWGDSKDNIYLSGMSFTIDRRTGFDAEMFQANIYSDRMTAGQANWVHPNQIGYMQMGDALAAVIAHIRKM